ARVSDCCAIVASGRSAVWTAVVASSSTEGGAATRALRSALGNATGALSICAALEEGSDSIDRRLVLPSRQQRVSFATDKLIVPVLHRLGGERNESLRRHQSRPVPRSRPRSPRSSFLRGLAPARIPWIG